MVFYRTFGKVEFSRDLADSVSFEAIEQKDALRFDWKPGDRIPHGGFQLFQEKRIFGCLWRFNVIQLCKHFFLVMIDYPVSDGSKKIAAQIGYLQQCTLLPDGNE